MGQVNGGLSYWWIIRQTAEELIKAVGTKTKRVKVSQQIQVTNMFRSHDLDATCLQMGRLTRVPYH